MDDFPSNAAEFYRLRDDRTNQCVTSRLYQEQSCSVTAENEILATPSGRAMLIASTNLLSRWCRRVALVLPSGQEVLGRELLAQMHDADPFGDFRIAGPGIQADLQLHLGPAELPSAPACVNIQAAGWYASLGERTLLRDHDENTIGAIAAACLGVAQVFKHAIGVDAEALIVPGFFDLFHLARACTPTQLPSLPPVRQLDFGRALLVGAGSVGSAAAYCIRMLGLEGTVTIVDPDAVKVENFNRSPEFGRGNYGANKAEAIAASLRSAGIEALGIPTSWNQFVKSGGLDIQYDVWLPLANEEGARWSMQSNLPPLMAQASTGRNWGVNFGRHIPGADDCLACRFPETLSEQHLICSAGPIPLPDQHVDAALPFLSLFAGLLIVAELVRLQLDPYPWGPNYALFDFGSRLSSIQAWTRRPMATCGCAERVQLRLRVGRKSRYDPLSPV